LLFDADQEIAASEALEHARQLEPSQVRHVRTRFSFLYSNGDTSRLIAEYEKFRDEWRGDPTLMNYASQSYFGLGLENEALTLAIKNANDNPGEAEVAACLATLHRKRGQREKALAWIEQWTATHGEQAAIIQVRAEIALEQEHYALALKDIDALLAQDRADESAFILRIRALRGLGRGIEARSELHQWSEHHKMSAQVTRLLEDDSSGDPWGKPKASGLDG
jgi:tetratricopeptide (TPR) repeat protein